MRAHERFLEYVKVYTTSDPTNESVRPSSPRQFVLAKQLAEEMQKIGISDVKLDTQCYVYGVIPATAGHENAPAIGLIAHMDTAPAFSGENVKPLLHPNYNGEDVHLPNGHTIGIKTFPELAKMKGETLITASGDTLLGADDKAGIAEILTACEHIITNNIPHGKICIGFTPDEEIGCGADGFDVKMFGAQYAYTADGGDVGGIEYETFNAAEARIELLGVAVHPGSAYHIMVNALKMGMELASFLPKNECPEETQDREGFFHLDEMGGNVEKCTMLYIIRDHDREKFEARKQLMQNAVQQIQNKYGASSVRLQMKDSYYNMAEIVEKEMHLIENARKAIKQAGIEPVTEPVRGGTDGSRLSFMGLPCPNLGTGGHYFHGPNECITVERMDKAVEVLVNLVKIYAE